MWIITEVSVAHRRALKQTMLYVAKAPPQARLAPNVYLRAMRSALRMSQPQLARRSGVAQSHIAKIESGNADFQVGTLMRLFDAMLCDVMIVPVPRQRPGDVLFERRRAALERELPARVGRRRRRLWDD